MHQTFFIGVVENRIDPLRLGRCQVRVVGLHTEDKTVLPTEKLPWAVPIQNSDSAGISGIGKSPTGLVEGTVVKIEFADPDMQQPFIIGSIGGIPQNSGTIDYTNDDLTIKNSDGDLPENITNQEPEQSSDIKPANQYTEVSDRLLDFIKQSEKLVLTSYQDSGGVWTIGYGTTLINGLPVQPGMTITEAQADEYLKSAINNDAADAVRKNVKVALTPSMFDALTSLTYNMGRGNFYKSELRTALNSSNYLDSAGLFSIYNKDSQGSIQNGLIERRAKERALFLSDGVPNLNNEVITEVITPVDEQSENGISPGLTEDQIGFKDPKGIYPLYKNEPDTNRLARHEQIDKTIVRRKEISREKKVPIAGAGNRTWDQPYIPYNAQYPFNQVYASESGHILEFDDTKNSERVHLYHRSGTFEEIDANGTKVTRIVGDGFEIYERNGNIHINGECNVTVDGAKNVRVGGVLNLDVIGKTTVNIYNDVEMNVSGKMDLSVKEDLKIKAANIFMEASNLDIRANTDITGNVNLQTPIYKLTSNDTYYRYDGDLHTHIGADTYNRHDDGIDYSCPSDPPRSGDIDCTDISSANVATATGLVTPSIKQTPEVLNFSKLNVKTRGAESASNYETPEDGDPTSFIDYRINKGLVEPEDLEIEPVIEKTEPVKENQSVIIETGCEIIFGMEEFQPSLQLSKYFTLGALNKQGTRKPINQLGLTKQEIVCNLKKLAVNCLDPIYELYPNMIISSGFRRPGDAKNSSPTSQHYKGEAADIELNGYTREQVYDAIKVIQQSVPHDQLLLEYSTTSVWIHISFKESGNRKQAFTMRNHKRASDNGTFVLIS